LKDETNEKEHPMSRIVIVGGGFAGIWSAAGAARLRRQQGLSPNDLQIILIDPQEHMVIRPRLYEAHPAEMGVSHRRILEPIDVQWLRGRATEIDHPSKNLFQNRSGGRRGEDRAR
jgi:NADH dehydrogenase